MALYDALLSTDIRIIHCRHEAACVHMADAWGRLTGRPGVAGVTAAQGHTNAAALYTAPAAESLLYSYRGIVPQVTSDVDLSKRWIRYLSRVPLPRHRG